RHRRRRVTVAGWLRPIWAETDDAGRGSGAVTSKRPSMGRAELHAPRIRVPDCRRSLALNAQTCQTCQIELSPADAVHQIDVGDRDRRIYYTLTPGIISCAASPG